MLSNKNIQTNPHNPSRYQLTSKKQQFQNSWSITYRKPTYDALADPHASYYFLNKSMRKHLKSLKKSIQKQGAFSQRKKIRYMIGQRIKDYDSIKLTTKVQAYYFNMKSSPSISSLKSKRSQKIIDNGKVEGNGDNQQAGQKYKDDDKDKDDRANKMKFKNSSKTIDVKSHNQQQQNKTKYRRRSKKQLTLPKLSRTIDNSKNDKDQKNNEGKITKLQNQILKSQKQQKKINSLNSTEHNKFIKFIVERKKKLQPSTNNLSKEIDKQKEKNKEKDNQLGQENITIVKN